ncbi:MAG: hypothetical protein A3F13_02165 [Gammaproteobacteria bacterium RIFCSPHIGHO2_12_FULL_40_19]|nr:MAG: hypothetical protein A3F13_02165 [Gammaproteobacteria bacterium RIFCSPHIGHO2_12_FULL_40_19]
MEHQYFHPILMYLRENPHTGLLFTFFVAFLESLPLIGTIIPGTVTMTIVGILIGTGALPPILSFVIASLAAFAGDSIGFIIGYHYNERLRTMWPFRSHPQWLAMGEAFFKKHGGKSILIGRFIGPARSTVPLIAGLLRLTWLRFMIAALPSAFLWALMYLIPGVLLGAVSREIPKGDTTRFFLYGIGIIAAIWFVFWVIQHFFIQLTRAINFGTDRLWNYLSRKTLGRILIKDITNQQKPSDHHQLTLFFTAVLSGILFLILFFNVRHQGALTDFNYPVFHVLQSIRTLICNKIFVVITIMGMPTTLAFISIVMTAGLLFAKQWRSAAHFLAAFLLSAGAVFVFKTLSHAPRPQGFEHVATSFSFPSGHTTLSLVIFSFIAFLMTTLTPKKWRWIPFTLSTTLIVLVAFSRLYLGEHWLADVIGSLLLGLAILLLVIISYRRMPRAKSAFHMTHSRAVNLLVISLCIPWSIQITHNFSTYLHNTTPVWPKQKITINAWWNDPLNITPLYRNNRFGKPFQPFNVQWQGSLQAITQTLKKNGWEPISNDSKLKLKSTLQRFSSREAQYHMPLLDWLYRNKPPEIFMIKHIPLHGRIIEFRLWKSTVHFQPENDPLWIGGVDTRIAPKVLLSIKEHTKISLLGDAGLDELYNNAHQYQRKIMTVSVNPALPEIKKLNWDGKILLIRETNH